MAGASVLADLAPTGRLRAAINVGNAVLAHRDGSSASGVSVELARALALRLGVDLDLVIFDAAGNVFQALDQGLWDIAFLAIEPARAVAIDFTEPYVLLEGVFAVPQESAIRHPDEVDRDGCRISVARGSGYDLFLSRTIRRATLVRWNTGQESMRKFVSEELEASANIRPMMEEFLALNPGYRLVLPAFMTVEQAMAVPKGRTAGADYVKAFLREIKASRFVAETLVRSGQPAALAAPL
ncbi:MAG: transporter substrate-binding domain-containing protein [Pseudorhodoplanes sp.]|nr:transporter substrate-binding domain-containing protein [Pseudorhodoplanes sp.]